MCVVIEDKDVTPINLSLELEQAVVRHELGKDNEIYVTETGWFPFWIRVYRVPGQVVLSTHTRFRKAVSAFQRLELANEMNKRFTLISVHVDDSLLRIDHCLLFRDGLTRESFIRACRVFNDSVRRAMDDLDPDDSILLGPGESESTDQSHPMDPQ